MRYARWAVSFQCLAMVACNQSARLGLPDGGDGNDSGWGVDGGPPSDGGQARDGGLTADAGPRDAGTVTMDSGTPVDGGARDSGTLVDGGAGDSGTPVDGGACIAASNAWTNTALASQSGTFSVEFDATPSTAAVDGVIALSLNPASAFTNLAAIARFNVTGTIDARNGGVYAAATAVSYVAGTPYHFRMAIDVGARTYSVFVRVGAGSEQPIGAGYGFRTEQVTISSLNNWVTVVDPSSTASLQVCNFTLTAGQTDTTPPTVTMTAPDAGATVSGTISVSASATDDVSVAGVQFLLDGTALAAEVTQAPYAINLDTTGVLNGTHALSARARDGAGNTATAPPLNVTVSNAVVTGTHPRIWLDPASLSTLRALAQAASPQWLTLRAACNSYLGGVVQPPSGNAYPNLPDIGQGYQGSDYVDPLMNVGVCYQVGLGTGDSNTAQWGQKGVDIVTTMATFTSYGTDSGYGIRFYGTGMALGFDFLYPLLSATQKSQVATALNAWLSFYDTGGFGRGQAHGNYFAGYYAAKAYAGLATEGDNANAGALWTDFLTRMHGGGSTALSGPEGTHAGVQLFYSKYLVGGGWAEGWGYGPLAVVNMSLPSLAARTAKGLDLIGDPAAPFSYPLDNGANLMHFLWPGRNMLDDRDVLHEGNAGTSFPARPSAETLTTVAGMLGRWNHPLAPRFHSYAREVRALVGIASPWRDFLFWDETAAEQPYTAEPLSYLSSGLNAAAMRSDWSTTATWGSMRATAYVDNPYSGEQFPDTGGLAIVKGSTPFLVNATGVLVTTYPGATTTYETDVYNDIFGAGTPRLLNNTFHNGAAGQDTPPVDGTPAPTTQLSHFEDRGTFVAMRGDGLQDVYPAGASVGNWTRDVVYLRPNTFVVYDRTTVGDTSGDQRMHWHLFFTPTPGTAPAGGTRYDVTNPTAGFLGGVTTVLPQNAPTTLVNVLNSNKVYRLEVRPSVSATTQRWLTVFDAAASSAGVAAASSLSSSSNVNGVLLTGSGSNSVVLFGAQDAGASTSGAVTFTEPAVATQVVVTDLAPNTGYSVSVTVNGNHSVTLQAGAGFTTSANGTLSVRITAGGQVN